uniref:Uncharacterized protein n=1 Tax=Guillardia theta TaxID=55529 RepID=A0A7S4NS28_GUITH|mmetsp:Transcript_29989/g.96173  ORF Transcript_29989/g.96173 Transcript_29989/m.96173 type:complete len:229 (+) Transcript_29989:660-1346(+)
MIGIFMGDDRVSRSFYHTVAVTHHGALFTWGDGKEGKLGHNDNAQRLIPTLVAAFIEWGMPVAAAQAGGSHTLVLNRRGQVFSFGSGDSGRLGHGNDNDQWSPTFLSALESERCVSIAAGFAHSVALTDQGQIYTWGCGKLGRLGHGSDSDEVLPRKLALISHDTIKAIAVAAGEAHTCIFRSEGSLITLGRVSHGRMAEGSCAQDMLDTLHTAISRQSSNDWHHFPS